MTTSDGLNGINYYTMILYYERIFQKYKMNDINCLMRCKPRCTTAVIVLNVNRRILCSV